MRRIIMSTMIIMRFMQIMDDDDADDREKTI